MTHDSEAVPRSLPDVGRFHYDDWVEICACSKDSVDRTIREYGVPVIDIPGQKIIDAALWWAAIYRSHAALAGKGNRK